MWKSRQCENQEKSDWSTERGAARRKTLSHLAPEFLMIFSTLPSDTLHVVYSIRKQYKCKLSEVLFICKFSEIFRNFGNFWQSFSFYLSFWQFFSYFLSCSSIPMQIFSGVNWQFFLSGNLHVPSPAHAFSFQTAFWRSSFHFADCNRTFSR